MQIKDLDKYKDSYYDIPIVLWEQEPGDFSPLLNDEYRKSHSVSGYSGKRIVAKNIRLSDGKGFWRFYFEVKKCDSFGEEHWVIEEDVQFHFNSNWWGFITQFLGELLIEKLEEVKHND
jgi:hypothetical protein